MESFVFELDSQKAPTKHGAFVSVAKYHAKSQCFLLGNMFSSPCLWKVETNSNGDRIKEVTNLQVEEFFGEKPFGISGGLESFSTGETAFSVIQSGFLPSSFRKNINNLTANELVEFFLGSSGGMGAHLRHSIVQVDEEGKFDVRINKDPGYLFDTKLIGDFMFGLSGQHVWKEPYLNPEKRELLKKDLLRNFELHRDADGLFWLLSQKDRLLRMGQTDVKGKPTPLRPVVTPGEPDFGFVRSAASRADGWLYGIGRSLDRLFRIRMNPVSAEEEYQDVWQMDGARLTGLCVVENDEKAKIVVAVDRGSAPEVWVAPSAKSEDPEMAGEAPVFEKSGIIEGLSSIGAMCVDRKNRIFFGEGYLGQHHKAASNLKFGLIHNV